MVITKGIHNNSWITNANLLKTGKNDLSSDAKMFKDDPRKIDSTTIIYSNPITIIIIHTAISLAEMSLWLLFSAGSWTCNKILENMYLPTYKYLKL